MERADSEGAGAAEFSKCIDDTQVAQFLITNADFHDPAKALSGQAIEMV
ncbi:hypothetical protein [Limimaricola sp.]